MNGEDRRLSQKNQDMFCMFCSELEIQLAGMFNVSTFNLNTCMVYFGGSSIKVDFFFFSVHLCYVPQQSLSILPVFFFTQFIFPYVLCLVGPLCVPPLSSPGPCWVSSLG